jgi:hypothetical protein
MRQPAGVDVPASERQLAIMQESSLEGGHIGYHLDQRRL